MKTGDIKRGMGRRSLLAAVARLPVVITAAYAGILSRRALALGATADAEPALGAHELAVLQRFAWLLFPVPGLAQGPYEKVAAGIAVSVSEQPAQLALVRDGIAQMDSTAGGSFLDLPEPAQVEHLHGIEADAFFQLVYTGTRSRLFDDREVWALIGYEGSSLEKGGYLNRGLADIDWL